MSALPKGKAWGWLLRDTLQSAEWRGLGINARRLIDFLMIEHMNHGGRRNGFLLAPRDQLEQFGIGRRLISAAIDECVAARLVDVRRGKGRQPSVYALTWMPVAGHEGDLQQGEIIGHHGDPQGVTKVTYKARSRSRRCTATAQNKGSPSCTPYKKFLPRRSNTTDLDGEQAPPPQRNSGRAPR